MAVSPVNGRLWMTFAAQGKDAGADSGYVVLSTTDDGIGFREMLVADPDGDGSLRATAPDVWVAADGRLRWSWREEGPNGATLKVLTLSAEDEPVLPLDAHEAPEGVVVASCGARLDRVAEDVRSRSMSKVGNAARRVIFTPTHAELSRRVCAEGFVLLKNDGALPLAAGSRVAVFGPATGEWLSCGGMSARVNPHYVIDVPEGLRLGGFAVDPSSRETAVLVITRTCGRGGEPDLGAYELKDSERRQLADVKAAGFRRIVVILNTGVAVATRELAADPAVSAVLQVGFAGMEGGRAVADILSGAVNPSGRLVQTLANRATDYPADANWQEAIGYVPYEDDIFVGYRYFETIPGASGKVTYPFGYGLSYTTFERTEPALVRDGNICRVSVTVRNAGKRSGRHSELVYTSLKGGRAEHPARELRAFAKTRLLEPGESERLEMAFDSRQLAYFDDTGVSGRIGSWAIDGGTYTVWIGGDVRDVVPAGSFAVESEILSTPGFKLDPARLARRLHADGTYETTPVVYGDRNGPVRPAAYPTETPHARILLADVACGKATLDAFIDQLSVDDIVALLTGHPNLNDYCDTCSFGVLEKYGSCGVQTADGPLGVRIDGVPTTQFPGTDVLAATFDVSLAEACGRVLGVEARRNGIDVMLAPGVNLNRHPVCARNFEFMGEDPCLAGRMAAGVIRGIQKEGVAATIKHFAADNRVNACLEYMSVISERAAREIYFKPFEIGVKEAKPACVMTAYNGLNGRFAGANWGALEGILRGEWGFGGLVMTDWGAHSQLWAEISSGNDVKMPDDDGGAARFRKMLKTGVVDPKKVRASVRRTLELVMASPRFRAARGCAD